MLRAAVITVAVLFLVGLQASSGAEDLEKTRQDLQQLQQQIRTTSQQLTAKKKAARKLVNNLHAGEKTLRKSRAQLRKALETMKNLQGKISSQQEAVALARRQQATLEDRVKERLRVLYKGGDTQLVKVLFSAQTPAAMAEDYHYLQRMVRHDRQLLEEYRLQVQNTRKELQQLAALKTRQQQALNERKNRESDLLQAQKDRRKLLAKVRQDEEALAVLLHELEERAARLTELVRRLKEDKTSSRGHGTRFSRQRGRLAWPVRGPVRVGFGTGRHPELGTRYDSHGIEIGVKGTKPIHSVWDGAVIFAKPFRGYGNLLIIDHGDGYYTLYAQASRLLRKVGDRVERGETIAMSGFDGADVVYFEIRKGGTPLDPLRWLARQRR